MASERLWQSSVVERLSPFINYGALAVAPGLQVLAGLYVMVRGLNNVGTGPQGTKWEVAWSRIFGHG